MEAADVVAIQASEEADTVKEGIRHQDNHQVYYDVGSGNRRTR